MELLPRSIINVLTTLFVICSFLACRAEDCGGKTVSRTITVDQSGASNFTTVQAAIDSIDKNNNQWVQIHIKSGTYTEKVQIPPEKPCIFLEGEGSHVTTITSNDHQETDTSATFTSSPKNVVVKDITFKNSFNVGARWNMRRMGNLRQGVVPALAARIYGDKSAFYGCGFIGYQDTLWDALGRHYFNNCYIEGSVDFIFGDGQSYYEDCTLNVIDPGYITAQGRGSPNDPSGFVFRRGSVGGKGKSFLGRAYGPYSRVIFYGTKFDDVIDPRGWSPWNNHNVTGFTFAEVECEGPGADTSGRVLSKNLTSSELSDFSISKFIDQDGWLEGLPIMQ